MFQFRESIDSVIIVYRYFSLSFSLSLFRKAVLSVCVRDSIALRIKERFASSPRDAREISLLYRVSTKRVYTRVYIHACMSVDIESIIAFETSYSTDDEIRERLGHRESQAEIDIDLTCRKNSILK